MSPGHFLRQREKGPEVLWHGAEPMQSQAKAMWCHGSAAQARGGCQARTRDVSVVNLLPYELLV